MNWPKSTLAAILAETNKPLVIDEIALPEQLDVGQVLVKMLYSGVCGSQIGEIQATKGPDKYLPHLLGHEGVGLVCGIGPGVTKVKPNETVVLHWRRGSGIDAAPPALGWRGNKLNAGQITTFSNYSVISENRMTRLTGDISLPGAALLGCAVLTGVGAVNNDAQVKIGESVVVLGTGGVGLNVVEAAVMAGAYPVIGVDKNGKKLQLAQTFGASHVLEVTGTEDICGELERMLPDGRADVVIECTGVTSLIEAAYTISGRKGRVILVGVPRLGEQVSLYTLPLHFGKRLQGTEGGQADPDVDIPKLVRLASAGRLKLDKLITETLAFRDIQKAISLMISGDIAGRCVIAF